VPIYEEIREKKKIFPISVSKDFVVFVCIFRADVERNSAISWAVITFPVT
jgi:hypothetical protein